MGLSNNRSSSSSSSTRRLLSSLLCGLSPFSDHSQTTSDNKSVTTPREQSSSPCAPQNGSSSCTNQAITRTNGEQHNPSTHPELQQPATTPSDMIINLDHNRPANQHSDSANVDNTTTNDSNNDTSPPTGSQPLLGFMLPEREEEQEMRGGGRGASVLVVDVVSLISSNREGRRNSRRMFRDTFSRSSFGRNSSDDDSATTIVITTSRADDDVASHHDRWLLDFGGDLHFSSASARARQRWSEHPLRSSRSYEMSERFQDVHDEQDSLSSLTGFSHIIMLAGALSEVLEEIHQHRMTFFPLTMPSLPAPEAVVNSFPLKNYTRPQATEDCQQCHICLVDYEDEDSIRVLPCSHEYHMLCIDKWLKEVHGVCPLCRDDVCKGNVPSSTSNPGNPPC